MPQKESETRAIVVATLGICNLSQSDRGQGLRNPALPEYLSADYSCNQPKKPFVGPTEKSEWTNQPPLPSVHLAPHQLVASPPSTSESSLHYLPVIQVLLTFPSPMPQGWCLWPFVYCPSVKDCHTKTTNWVAYSNRNLFSHGSEDQKSETKVEPGL